MQSNSAQSYLATLQRTQHQGKRLQELSQLMQRSLHESVSSFLVRMAKRLYLQWRSLERQNQLQ